MGSRRMHGIQEDPWRSMIEVVSEGARGSLGSRFFASSASPIAIVLTMPSRVILRIRKVNVSLTYKQPLAAGSIVIECGHEREAAAPLPSATALLPLPARVETVPVAGRGGRDNAPPAVLWWWGGAAVLW